MITIKEEFADLLRIAYKPGTLEKVPQQQVEELEKVFFAGAQMMLKRVEAIVNHPKEQESAFWMEETKGELKEFFGNLEIKPE